MFNDLSTIENVRETHDRSIIRILAAALGVILLTVTLIVQIIRLQVVDYTHYTTRSKDNRMRVIPVPPTRGEIYDRNGDIVAENQTQFKLQINPQRVDDIEALLNKLKRYVTLSDNELRRFNESWKRNKKGHKPVLLKLRLTLAEQAKIAAHRPNLIGAEVSGYLSRHYPFKASTAHVVGYVGRISNNDLARVNAENYAGTVHFGKSGIERSYENQLHGTTGISQVETNAAGRIVRLIRETPPIPGDDLVLNIDMQLQQAAEKALGEHNGAIVALEPKTGAVLALVSMPHFDPNLFVHGISHADFNAINSDRRRPMFNRSIKGQYPPGSTLKPMVALAALEKNIVSKLSRVLCTGSYQLENNERKYRDWKREGHGHVNLNYAIAQSCDIYFYDTGFKLGINQLHDYLYQFNLGQRTAIDLIGERKGLLPSREWKRGAKGKSWYQGETLITSIGQGFMLTTPLQLAQSAAILANRGKTYTPHIVKTDDNEIAEPVKSFSITAAHYRSIIKAMQNVTSSPYGTARSIGEHLDYVIAGKTGTAQVYGLSQEDEDEDAEEPDIPAHLRDHALFISFAPSHKPQIAVAVVAEHGGSGGAVAAPIAREVTHFWLKKQGISQVSGKPPISEEVTFE